MIRILPALFLLLAACKSDPTRPLPDTDPDTDTGTEVDPDTDTEEDTSPVPTGPLGFIGGPCDEARDCEFDGAVCLGAEDGFPAGMCSLPCDRLCPDEAGYPVTFCASGADLPEADFNDGACVSRCDFGVFPDTGCRAGYGCAVASREGEADTERYVCLPNTTSDLTDCQLELAARGVSFEPTLRADEIEPSTGLTCHIEEPVFLRPPILGVDLRYYNGTATPTVLMSCDGAHAVADTVEDAKADGVDTILHIGTYVCRSIAGTSSLSRHAYGDAIDYYGFEFSDGRRYILEEDWVHDQHPPPVSNAAARWLYDAAYRWYDEEIWNIILTPNYNSAHDNHFHVDLTPGGDFIRSPTGGRYIGPAPYVD